MAFSKRIVGLSLVASLCFVAFFIFLRNADKQTVEINSGKHNSEVRKKPDSTKGIDGTKETKERRQSSAHGGSSLNVALATRHWLESKARPLSPKESKLWLESKNYSSDAFLAILMSNNVGPEGIESATFYREMFERHKDDPAVVLYGLLMEFQDKKIVNYDAETLKLLDPGNPLVDYISAFKQAQAGNIEIALKATKEASVKNSPEAYLGRIRQTVSEMFLFSGRSEEGAQAWSNFSIRETDLASLGLKFKEIFDSKPPNGPGEIVQRAAFIADIGLLFEEIPMAGPDLYSWNGFTMPDVIRTLTEHPSEIKLIFNDSLENVLAQLNLMEQERAGEASFYFGAFAQVVDKLTPDQRSLFYKEASLVGPANALVRLADLPK